MRHLTAMLGTYPKTAPLKRRDISSALVTLDFADVDVAQRAFKDVVRGGKYDVAELALITFLMAYEAGKPYVLLPFVMNGGFRHDGIHCRTDSDLTPRELAGRRVAMRSYSQTTPAWVRGILADDYGVRVRDVRWLTQEGAHVEGYAEPAWVSRIEDPRGLRDLLIDGEVDAIIAGSGFQNDLAVRPLIPEPAKAARDWYRRTNVVPINHMVVIRKQIVEKDGDVAGEVYRMLLESRAVGEQPQPGIDLQPIGFVTLHGALEMAIRFAYDQGLITKKYAVDELYGSVAAQLN